MSRLSILSLALLLSACTVGPHYRQPAVTPIAAAPFRSTGRGLDPAGDLPPRWWSLYNDPSLDALVEEALVHNSDLRVAAANLERAQAVLREQSASLLPITSENAAVVRGRGGATGSSGTGTTTTTGSGTGATVSTTGTGTTGSLTGATITPPVTNGVTETVQRYGATFSYEVDLFGRVRSLIRSARADVAATEATRDATRVTVAAATTQAYLNVCAIGRELDVANQNVGVVEKSYQLTVKQKQLGAVSDYELSRVGVLLQQTRAAVPQLEGLRAASLYDLTQLLGRPANQVPDAASSCRAMPRLTRPLPVGDGAALLRRRPDVRSAERTLAGDVASVDVATAELFPTISLGGAINASGSSFKSATSRTGFSWGLGPLISWNVPNLLAARARVQEAGAEARASLARFDRTVLTALSEAEKALANYDAELRRNAALADAQAASQRAYQLSGVRVRYGSISQLEQLDVQRDLIATQTVLAASDATLGEDQVAVFRALGGGWQDAPVIDPAPRAIGGSGGIKPIVRQK
ncbi:NodT family efflux transporter outer membrane factor (OMF) lipoprotein [Sphingomonas vulcanisoli]|uniref:NodT family efflux transporter outer membrane factor (OMF) lipoprotein n=1 Tax=Sphingomonas vulcanisoli TaxID=1658060 RepID=A0ABX0TPB3_9SPHN|nr:TolC family protein [Sphingomonas vulcanisoli]NIJ07372.1 NodT family efflux transporter outer membrane factor (OMF) lipoprotein [Sphingomonas vulcanisoli]